MSRRRPDRKSRRREEAALRQAAANQRTSREQLTELDDRLGRGAGAERERARLWKMIGGPHG